MKRDYKLYLDDLIESIEKIEEYVQRLSFDDFTQDGKTIDAVVRNLEVMGEAAKHIPQKLRDKYPAVPWREMAGMRDKLIHGYFGINLDVVWKTIEKRLPETKTSLKQILRESSAN